MCAAQKLCNTIWGMACLGEHPRRVMLDKHLWTVDEPLSACACAVQRLCNMIWGMARLGEHPGPVMMAKYLQKVDVLLNADTLTYEDRDQGISNTLWSLTVLDELRPGFVDRVSGFCGPVHAVDLI